MVCPLLCRYGDNMYALATLNRETEIGNREFGENLNKKALRQMGDNLKRFRVALPIEADDSAMPMEGYAEKDFLGGEIICVDKPYGWTSFDVVKRLRGAVQRRMNLKKFKVGHAGTLDPLATGVLMVCTGRATRRIDELQEGVKEYVADVRLGVTTPSFDLETEPDGEYPTDHITREMVEHTLRGFVGEIMQVPPVYSAVKVEGKRAYEHARKGNEVEIKAKPLKIDEIELLEYSQDHLKLRIVCSKGTYIRALARDLGKALGSGAHLTALRRTRVGEYGLKEMLTLPQAMHMIQNSPVKIEETIK